MMHHCSSTTHRASNLVPLARGDGLFERRAVLMVVGFAQELQRPVLRPVPVAPRRFGLHDGDFDGPFDVGLGLRVLSARHEPLFAVVTVFQLGRNIGGSRT